MMVGIMLHFGLREIGHIRRDQTGLKTNKPQNKTKHKKQKPELSSQLTPFLLNCNKMGCQTPQRLLAICCTSP